MTICDTRRRDSRDWSAIYLKLIPQMQETTFFYALLSRPRPNTQPAIHRFRGLQMSQRTEIPPHTHTHTHTHVVRGAFSPMRGYANPASFASSCRQRNYHATLYGEMCSSDHKTRKEQTDGHHLTCLVLSSHVRHHPCWREEGRGRNWFRVGAPFSCFTHGKKKKEEETNAC